MEMKRDNEPNETPDLPKLAAALRRTQARRVFVPPTVDEAILRAAERSVARVPSWLWIRWVAVTAAVILVCTVGYWFKRPGAELAREDVNRDGQVDVLDAFQLARELKAGMKTARDVNGDGVADQRDVDVIASRAVRLEKGGPS